MENKYPEGSIVYAKVNPGLKLAVRRYARRIYYCTNLEHPLAKELVYYERELMDGPTAEGN
ncbi:hypothetical protein [Pontibacter amylolyticus]|uniref:Uncharacterized protein n=1 Tax=Pontibacter amylolyticus TaxID=1424080 RepID=A0ABQ1WB16_9BACT|nr:hypothetical protein [Pontibacter amylolyticus]GGG23078.1 hypothetical protein GCM10011323_28770 [Pontibacter amylolyticus]